MNLLYIWWEIAQVSFTVLLQFYIQFEKRGNNTLNITIFPILRNEAKNILIVKTLLSFKRQPQKMVKHRQTIFQLLPMNCVSVLDHFEGLMLKGLKFIDTAKYLS